MELLASFKKFGAAKFGWFITLKNSARNCTLSRSLKLKFLNVEKSTVVSPGPSKPVSAGIAYENASRNRRCRRKAIGIKCQQVPKSVGLYSGRRIATGNELRMIHEKVAVETSVEGIASSAEGHGERRIARRGNDGAKLPPAEDLTMRIRSLVRARLFSAAI
jgi:hypothetical protein